MSSNIYIDMSEEVTSCRKTTLNINHYSNDSIEFIKCFSEALYYHKKKGTIAFYTVKEEELSLLIVASWHAGWKVAIIPDNNKNDLLISEKLNVDILIDGNKQEEKINNENNYLTLFIDTSYNEEISILFWLDKYKTSINKKTSHSYIWKRNETALILFTSGSTGQPKGICHSLHNMIYSAKRFINQFNITDNDKLLNVASLHTMSGFRASVMLPLLSSCKLITLKNPPILSNILHVIGQDKPTMMIVGPNIVKQISILSDKLSNTTSSLKAIFSTGAKLDRNDRKNLYRNLNIPVLDYYGLTETSGLSIAESIDDYEPEDEAIGKACNDVNLTVIKQNGTECLYGVGELRIYSNSIFLGYLGEQQKQQEFFNSGDQVRIDTNGTVTWLGRLKNGIKSAISTEWIYSEVVENWLRNNDLIEDVHVRTFYDENNRAGFYVEVAGIPRYQWKNWKNAVLNKLIHTLGEDYNIIQWSRCEKIIRSSLGKYQYSEH